MPTKPATDHNADPGNSTLASRAAARATQAKPARRRMALRAGDNAETDFTVTQPGGGDRVRT